MGYGVHTSRRGSMNRRAANRTAIARQYAAVDRKLVSKTRLRRVLWDRACPRCFSRNRDVCTPSGPGVSGCHCCAGCRQWPCGAHGTPCAIRCMRYCSGTALAGRPLLPHPFMMAMAISCDRLAGTIRLAGCRLPFWLDAQIANAGV